MTNGITRASLILIGSNIRPEWYLPEALRILQDNYGPIIRLGRAWLTDPWRAEPPEFLNVAVVLGGEPSTTALHSIERQLDRPVDHDSSAPRTIDIDLQVIGTLSSNRGVHRMIAEDEASQDWREKPYAVPAVADVLDEVVFNDRCVQTGLNGLGELDLASVRAVGRLECIDGTVETRKRLESLAVMAERHLKESYIQNDLPIVAVCEFKNVISIAQTSVVRLNDRTAHAEMCVLRSAAKASGNRDMRNAVLYCTHEPCQMCLSAAASAGVSCVGWSIDKWEQPWLYRLSFGSAMKYRDLEMLYLARGIQKMPILEAVRHCLSTFYMDKLSECSPTKLPVTAFYDRIAGEYDDPLAHPVSVVANGISRDYLRELLRITTGQILDLGCGVSDPLDGRRVIGLDVSATMLARRSSLYPGANGIIMDLNHPTQLTERASGAIGSLLVDHIDDLVGFLQWLDKNLECGASVVFTWFKPATLPPERYMSGGFRYRTVDGLILETSSRQRSCDVIVEYFEKAGFQTPDIAEYQVGENIVLQVLKCHK